MLNIIFIMLTLLSLLLMLLIIFSSNIWDRILALNLFTSVTVLLIMVYAVMNKINYLIDIGIVYTLLGFIGIVFMVRFFQGKG